MVQVETFFGDAENAESAAESAKKRCNSWFLDKGMTREQLISLQSQTTAALSVDSYGETNGIWYSHLITVVYDDSIPEE
jgi:hypothetical protein